MTRSMAVLLLSAVVVQAEDASIFPDKALEAVVRKSVFEKRFTDAPLVAADVEKISTIKGPKAGIRSIQGLEHCRELRELNLSGNEISDLAPIKDLKYVQSLDVSENQISTLEPLREMKMLQYLNVAGNKISDLAPLAGHDTIWALYLERNMISDISVLGELPKLVALYLDDNQVTDISVASKLTRLERLGLNRNKVSDLSPLKASIYWKFIFLEENQITNLSPLIEMCETDMAERRRFAPFVRIYLEGNPLADEGKKQLESLKEMGIRLRSTKTPEDQ